MNVLSFMKDNTSVTAKQTVAKTTDNKDPEGLNGGY